MTLNQLLKEYGTQAEIGRKFGYTRAAVNHWKRIGGIPPRVQEFIQATTAGKFRAAKGYLKEAYRDVKRISGNEH